MKDKTLINLLRLVPKNLLSRFVGALASSSFSKPFIKPFARKYNINLDEAEHPIEHYPTLNQFFVRHLKEGARPIAGEGNSSIVVSPVDGLVAQCGPIEDGKMIQAKGLNYNVKDLLASNEEAAPYENGWFMTVYLAPTDYHRMHHYADGQITGMRCIPGRLWPVNPASVNNVKDLFPVNERFTTYYTAGPQNKKTAIVKVGATVVGKIKVSYHDAESNRGQHIAETFNDPKPIKKGEELGLFQMGSTVVMLFEPGSFKPDEEKCQPGAKFRVGEKIGEFV